MFTSCAQLKLYEILSKLSCVQDVGYRLLDTLLICHFDLTITPPMRFSFKEKNVQSWKDKLTKHSSAMLTEHFKCRSLNFIPKLFTFQDKRHLWLEWPTLDTPWYLLPSSTEPRHQLWCDIHTKEVTAILLLHMQGWHCS